MPDGLATFNEMRRDRVPLALRPISSPALSWMGASGVGSGGGATTIGSGVVIFRCLWEAKGPMHMIGLFLSDVVLPPELFVEETNDLPRPGPQPNLTVGPLRVG